MSGSDKSRDDLTVNRAQLLEVSNSLKKRQEMNLSIELKMGALIAFALFALLIRAADSAAAPAAAIEHGELEKHNPESSVLENFHYNSSHTPEEWTQLFSCRSKNQTTGNKFQLPLTNIWARVMEPECRRDPHSWRFKYVDEFRSPGSVYIRDASIDGRLANIIQTLNLHNMFDLSFSFFNSGDPELDARNEIAVAGPEVDDAKCARDLAHMRALFNDLQVHLASIRVNNFTKLETRHIQLAQVLDSYGRYESGSLDGKLRLVGSYDQCEASRLPSGLNSDETMRMRYCVANLDLNRDIHPTLRERKRYAHESSPGHLATAVCLPRSCHSRTLHGAGIKQHVQWLVDSQMRLPASIYVDQTYQIDSIFCLVDQDSEYLKLSLSGKLCLLFVSGWILFSLTVTFLNNCSPRAEDEKTKSEKRESLQLRLRKYFDLAQSWHDLTADKRPIDANEPVDLDMLNPIKLFCCFWCIMCHMTFMLGSISAGQGRIAAFVDLDPGFQVALLTSTIIDTFFTISGMLVTFVTITKLYKRSQRRRQPPRRQLDHNSPFMRGEDENLTSLPQVVVPPANNNGYGRDEGSGITTVKHGQQSSESLRNFMGQWFVLAANRYLRIVPLYAILFWFRRDVFTYLGSGPLWDHGLNKETPNGACSIESSWIPFTFWSAFMPMAKQCYIPSWSISVDILFGLLMPPILIMYVKRPKWAVTSVIALTLVNVLISIEATIGAEPGLIWEMLEARMAGIVLMFTGLSHLYTWPFVRAPAFLIGSLAGYYLFKYNLAFQHEQQQHQQQKQLRREQGFENKTNGHTSPTASTSASSGTSSGWPSWFKGIAVQMCWIYLVLHLLVSVFTVQLRHMFEPYHRFVSAYWLSADRAVWALAFATIFLRLVTDWRHKPFVKHFASQKWRTLSKLNFSIMFIHWMFILVYLGLLPTPANFTMWHIAAAVTVVTVASIPLAVIVYIIFENPMDKIVKNEIFRF